VTDLDITPAPIPADDQDVISLAPDVRVVVYFMGGGAPMELEVSDVEAATLAHAATLRHFERPVAIEANDAATNVTFQISAEAITAVGLAVQRTTWRLLVDATEAEIAAATEADGWPRYNRCNATDEDGFQQEIKDVGMDTRPPNWMRFVARDLNAEGYRTSFVRA
jgi:hypothetical protein